MNDFFDAALSTLGRLVWAADPYTQTAVMAVLALAVSSLLLVYGPLCLRLARIVKLQRSVAAAFDEESPRQVQQREIAVAFERSPLAFQWHEFRQRWETTRAADPESRAVDEGEARTPVRLDEILKEHPALPLGARRSLLPALPGLLLATGLLGTIIGLTFAIPDEQSASLVQQVGLALRSSLWGLGLSIAASVAARLIEGGFEAQSSALSLWVRVAYRSVTPGELSVRAAHAQRVGFDRLRDELIQVTHRLTDSLDTGLRRIEQSSAKAASLVSEQQRSALSEVVDQLAETLKRGVEEHLNSLQNLLQTVVDHQGTVTGGLTHAFERMFANSEAHARVTQSLVQASESVRDAADAIDETAGEFRPVLEKLRRTGAALEETASRIQSTQESSAHTADAVAASVEQSRRALSAQHQLLEDSLCEIRGTFEVLSRGLGENLSSALHGIDDALEQTVGRLRDTILESSETIDGMTAPIRAAEGVALETRATLEQVRSDVVSLNDWLVQTARPVRSILSQLGDKTTSLTRALQEFGDRARAVEHGMGELRGELRATGRSPAASEQAVEAEPLQQDEAATAVAGDDLESEKTPSTPDADAGELNEKEQPTRDDVKQAKGEDELTAGLSDTDAAASERQAEEEQEKPTSGPESNPDPTSGPRHRMEIPDFLTLRSARGVAAPGATQDRASRAALAKEKERDADSGATVSLSELLSRPRSASPEPQLEQPPGDRADASPNSPATAGPAGSSTHDSKDPQQPRSPEDERESHSSAPGAFWRLFGRKT